MTEEQLKAVMEAASGRFEKDGTCNLPEGKTVTLYASHQGVGLTVTKVESVSISGPIVRARTVKGELYLLATDDVFAASVEGSSASTSRKAGFL